MVDIQGRVSEIDCPPWHGGRHLHRQSDSHSDSEVSDDGSSETDHHPLMGAGSNRSQLGKRRRRLMSRKTVNVLEYIALIAALVVVIGMSSLPVIFYFKYSKHHEVSAYLWRVFGHADTFL